MLADYLPYLFAFSATLVFALSSIVYTNFSRQVSPLWMNTVKCLLAALGFFVLSHFFYGWHQIQSASLVAFLASGFIGLGVGDIFLLSAFSRIGPARTLMLFGFGPLMTGLIGYFAFGQELSLQKLTAIFFMLLCLFLFAFERFKKTKSWETVGLMMALLGVSLDSVGIGLTRYAFDQSPLVVPAEGNFYRCLGACIAFALISRWKPIRLFERFKELNRRHRTLVVLGSLGGTFISLWLYLSAVRIGHLASISAIGVTGPFFAALFEAIFYRERPSRYLILAGISFVCGFTLLIL